MKCLHCRGELVEHVGGLKDTMLHCNACGCCFLADGKTLRPGHPACAPAATKDDALSTSVVDPLTSEGSGPANVTADPAAFAADGPGLSAADAERPERTATLERRIARAKGAG